MSRPAERSFGWRTAFEVVTSVVMMGAAIALVVMHSGARTPPRPALQIPSEPIVVDGALRGSDTAPVVMTVFADFECPFCGRFAREILPILDREYIATGQVQLAYRPFPLSNHPHAAGAAAAAECAGEQGLFWPMHDRLFEVPVDLSYAGLRGVADSVDLDLAVFENCLDDAATSTAVTRDTDHAQALGVRSTPSFFFGTRLADGQVSVTRAFSGAVPVEEFRNALDEVLNGNRVNLSIYQRMRSAVLGTMSAVSGSG
jgi:protein-disulfide isomerase